MVQLARFEEARMEDLVSKLHKSLNDLKQSLRQWDFKFNEIVTLNGFKENVIDRCICYRFSENSYIFLVLYVDDILLASNDTNLLFEIKHMIDMKNVGDASFVLGIQILHDRVKAI